MNSSKALVARLTTDSTVTAVAGTRVWPVEAPAVNQYPRIIFGGEDAQAGSTYSGPDGLAQQKITVSCQALTYDEAAELASTVRLSLDGLRGVFGGVNVQGMFYEGEHDEQYSQAETGYQQLVYATELELLIWFNT